MDTTTVQLIELRENAGNSPVTLNTLQKFLAPHAETLVTFWFAVWCATAAVLLVKLWHEYKNRDKN